MLVSCLSFKASIESMSDVSVGADFAASNTAGAVGTASASFAAAVFDLGDHSAYLGGFGNLPDGLWTLGLDMELGRVAAHRQSQGPFIS